MLGKGRSVAGVRLRSPRFWARFPGGAPLATQRSAARAIAGSRAPEEPPVPRRVCVVSEHSASEVVDALRGQASGLYPVDASCAWSSGVPLVWSAVRAGARHGDFGADDLDAVEGDVKVAELHQQASQLCLVDIVDGQVDPAVRSLFDAAAQCVGGVVGEAPGNSNVKSCCGHVHPYGWVEVQGRIRLGGIAPPRARRAGCFRRNQPNRPP